MVACDLVSFRVIHILAWLVYRPV